MRQRIEDRGYDWDKWRVQCERCNWLDSEEAARLLAVSSEFNVEEVAFGLPEQESSNSHLDKNGNVIESEDGAIGKLQVIGKVGNSNGKMKKKRVKGGFDEIWYMFNEPRKYQFSFIEEFRPVLDKYRPFFTGSKKDVWNNLKSEKVNEVAGFLYLGFLKHSISGGDIGKALEMYYAGPTGREKFPEDSRRYKLGVIKKQERIDHLEKNVCPRIWVVREEIYNTLIDMHYGNIIMSDPLLRIYSDALGLPQNK